MSLTYKTSRREQLQRALGDVGTVLDRVPRGGGRYSAAGWYAEIGPELVYLGDHTAVAFATIGRLLEAEPELEEEEEEYQDLEEEDEEEELE